jgi:hypothetical protein
MFQPAPTQHLVYNLDLAAERGQQIMDASVRTWAAEGRAFVEDLGNDNAEALNGLGRCRTPLDVLKVGQRWWLARFKASLDAGMRLILGALHEPESAAAEATAFRLPE